MNKYEKIVNDYKTKNKQGFTKSELNELLKLFPTITESKFNEAFGVNTCLMIDGEIIFYHHDIARAISKCMGDISLTTYEFD